MALSTTLYAYLLAAGVCYLASVLVGQYAYGGTVPLITYAFPIIHIAFPLAYFLFNSFAYRHLARHWLQQRSANADSIAQEQSIAPYHGDLAAVEQAISTGIDLNAHIEHEHNAADEFTLLILACFNCHEDAVDLLLSHDEVQVNKGSRRQHWTPLYVAAMRGNTLSVGKLIVRGANVHVKTEDQQSALLAATTFGHTQIVQQLMEAGARKKSAWMGVDASAAAEELGRVSIVVSMRSYESHFQGHIRDVQGCACVASWPGIYSKSWWVLSARQRTIISHIHVLISDYFV
jgi:membrane protein implicated in regulation of membrane protease activity